MSLTRMHTRLRTVKHLWIMMVLFNLFLTTTVRGDQNGLDFNPEVSATCTDYPYMKIHVLFNQPFYGVVHTKDHRTEACEVQGHGTSNVTLILNVMAEPNSANDCGVKENEGTGERSVSIFVRYHKTLERLEDKPFSISCNNPGYINTRNDLTKVSLSFLEDGKKTKEVVQGRQYILSAEQTPKDDNYALKVKKCFTFSMSTHEKIDLTDDRGCPIDPKTMSRFKYNEEKGTADAIIFSMFKLPDTTVVNVNCMVAVCRGSCVEESCEGSAPLKANSITDNVSYQFWIAETAYVVEPKEPSAVPLVDCSIHRYSWLLGLCIAFGILFLIMLIVNILLCSALTCSCAKQEVIERDPSVIEDYDPYKTGGGWGSGSQYGSRYSLNGKHDYHSGGSTLNSTTRSISTNSDHYAVVHNHPGSSRYQGDDRSSKGGFGHHHHRGPESTISAGNHSGRM